MAEKEIMAIFHWIADRLEGLPSRTQGEVAKLIGVSPPSLTNYKAYRHRSTIPKANFATVYRLLRYFMAGPPIDLDEIKKSQGFIPDPE